MHRDRRIQTILPHFGGPCVSLESGVTSSSLIVYKLSRVYILPPSANWPNRHFIVFSEDFRNMTSTAAKVRHQTNLMDALFSKERRNK